MFLKFKRGKGAKFRRVPVSQRLRRKVIRYINKSRPDSPLQFTPPAGRPPIWASSVSTAFPPA